MVAALASRRSVEASLRSPACDLTVASALSLRQRHALCRSVFGHILDILERGQVLKLQRLGADVASASATLPPSAAFRPPRSPGAAR